MEMFDETSLPAAYFPSAQTPLTRRLLVYFHAAAYNDPAINPLYRDLLQHYGAVALP
jgi:hypothetical protein